MAHDYGDKLFAGAAKNYAKYRAVYPAELFGDIVKSFGLNGQGWLLDLGCGTGELAIPLAKYFEQVLAMDPDPEMLAEGRIKAKELDLPNIKWQKGSSKELSGLKGSYKLAVMGRSFHWMEQEMVLDNLFNLLQQGGGVVIIGTEPQRQGPDGLIRDKIIKNTVTKYLGAKRLAGSRIYQPPTQSYEQLLPKSKFSDFQKREYTIIFRQNVEQIMGNLFSMSWALPGLFGNNFADFEAELRRKLLAGLPAGIVTEKVCFIAYTLTK